MDASCLGVEWGIIAAGGRNSGWCVNLSGESGECIVCLVSSVNKWLLLGFAQPSLFERLGME